MKYCIFDLHATKLSSESATPSHTDSTLLCTRCTGVSSRFNYICRQEYVGCRMQVHVWLGSPVNCSESEEEWLSTSQDSVWCLSDNNWFPNPKVSYYSLYEPKVFINGPFSKHWAHANLSETDHFSVAWKNPIDSLQSPVCEAQLWKLNWKVINNSYLVQTADQIVSVFNETQWR